MAAGRAADVLVDGEDGTSCSVCMARPRTVRNLPCEHAMCCELCTLRIIADAGQQGAQSIRCPNVGRCTVTRLAFVPMQLGLLPPRPLRMRTFAQTESCAGAREFESLRAFVHALLDSEDTEVAKQARAIVQGWGSLPSYGYPIDEQGHAVVLDGLIELENHAFEDNHMLTSISLPAATHIGEWAFFFCSALTSISLPAATHIGDYAFNSCDALTSISLPAATHIGESAFDSCSALTSISLPVATHIHEKAFENCCGYTYPYSGLVSVSLPAATHIGERAFESCQALREISLPAATHIGARAFEN